MNKDQSRTATRGNRLPRVAVVVGILAVLGALATGFVGYRISLNMLEKEYRYFYLERARALAQMAISWKERESPAAIAKGLATTYETLGKMSPDEYMCIVDKAGRLLVHTLDPKTVGKYAGDNPVLGEEGFLGCSLKDLPNFKSEYVGGYISSAKSQQVAAFVYIPQLNWTLGVHRSRRALESEVRAGLLPVFLGMLIVCGLLIPLSLVLLYHTFRRAQHEQIRIEKELRSSEERLRLAQDAAKSGAWEWVVAGDRNIWSEEVWRLFGLEPDSCEPSFSSWIETIHPKDRARVQEAARRAADTGDEINIEWRVNLPEPQLRWLISRGRPQFDDQGNLVRYLGIVMDNTDRKRSEAELRASEERNRQIIQTTMDGFWRVDSEGRILEVNQAYCRMSGYSPEELLAMRVSELEADQVKDETAAHLKKIAGNAEDRFVSRHLRKDGSIFDVEVSLQHRLDEQGGESVCFLRDVSEQLRTERELRASEERFRQLYVNAPIAYQSLDPEGLIRDVNQVWLGSLGYDKDEVVGRWFGSFLKPDFVPHFEKNFYCFKDAGKVQGVEFQMRKKDGSAMLVSFNGSIAHDANGKMVCTHCVFQDITEQRRLEARLRQAQKMEALGTLSGGIAHDFNNILGAVLGWAEMAHADAVAGNANPADLEQIMLAAQRARDLVKQILTFSRKNEPALQPLCLNQACKRAQGILEHTLPKMISLETDLAQDLPHVLADPTQMEQVLLNLSSNAADAMSEGGRLTLATRVWSSEEDSIPLHPDIPAGEYVLLTVSDTGCGMVEDTLEHIFEPFFTTKGVGQGTGLGLSTVYGVVKSHGGFIHCASELGQGTKFSIFLPILAQNQFRAPIEATEADDAALAGQETILLADDEKALRDIAVRILSGAGYEVLETTSGEEALKAFIDQQPPPDLVVMDLGMPGMGGHKALKAILEINPQAKVIIVSGYSADAQVKAALESGAVAFVAKPFKRIDLLGTIRGVLDGG